jgi:YD repeat-containing protein
LSEYLTKNAGQSLFCADRITQITYPSGRIVTYTRDTTGRITGVATKLNATAASVSLASSVVYQPMSNLVKSYTYGNGLTEADTHTLDYELGRCQVSDGATKLVDLTPLRADNLNVTGLTDGVTANRNQSFAYSAANRLTSAGMTGTGGYGTRGYTYDGVGNRLNEQSTPVGGALSSSTYAPPTAPLQTPARARRRRAPLRRLYLNQPRPPRPVQPPQAWAGAGTLRGWFWRGFRDRRAGCRPAA